MDPRITDLITFDHFGLAVRAPEKSKKYLFALGYAIQNEVFDPVQKVNLAYLTHPQMPAVEIVYKEKDVVGPLEHILSVAQTSIYHVCYRVTDASIFLVKLKEANVRSICVSPPKPAILFGNKLVSFYMIDGFGLTELLEDRLDDSL